MNKHFKELLFIILSVSPLIILSILSNMVEVPVDVSYEGIDRKMLMFSNSLFLLFFLLPFFIVRKNKDYLMNFTFTNTTLEPMVAQAIPSVSPGRGAKYFHKTECFCFEQQYLAAGESITIPVKFIIDPEIPDDISSLALGYTLFDVTEQFAYK